MWACCLSNIAPSSPASKRTQIESIGSESTTSKGVIHAWDAKNEPLNNNQWKEKRKMYTIEVSADIHSRVVAGLDESGKTNLINQVFHFKHLLEQKSDNNNDIQVDFAGIKTGHFKFSWPDSESIFELLELPGSLLERVAWSKLLHDENLYSSIFVIDVQDLPQVFTVYMELERYTKIPTVSQCPLLIVFNKTEHQTAWSKEDKELLHDLYKIKKITHTFMDTLICSSVTGLGVAEVTEWLKHPTQNLELTNRNEPVKPNGAHFWV